MGQQPRHPTLGPSPVLFLAVVFNLVSIMLVIATNRRGAANTVDARPSAGPRDRLTLLKGGEPLANTTRAAPRWTVRAQTSVVQSGNRVAEWSALDRPAGGDELPIDLDTGLRLTLEVAMVLRPLFGRHTLRIVVAYERELLPVGRDEQRG